MSLCVRLLWGDKPPVVATDANAPRRPCAGSLSPLGMTQECCRRRGRCCPQVLGTAAVGAARRRQKCENRNILFLAHLQRIAHYYLTINDNK